jgi:hypothetical protein
LVFVVVAKFNDGNPNSYSSSSGGNSYSSPSSNEVKTNGISVSAGVSEEIAAIQSKRTAASHVNISLVETLKDSWQNKPRAEQKLAIALMIGIVHHDIEDVNDQEATQDYIQENIGSW